MPDSTTIGQRFTQLIQQLGLSKNAFAQSLNKTATVIQHLVDERNYPGYELLCKVFEVYPNVSKNWLMLGQGPMLLEADAVQAPITDQPTGPTTPAADTIDLAPLAGPSRRRAGPHLQPADIAATLALATKATEPPTTTTLGTPSLAAPIVPPSAAAAPAPPTTQVPAPALAPDASYLATVLQTQYLQHQLALAEQRNQHLLEQQALLQQMVRLLQKA